METYEYVVVTADGKIRRIIADSIKGVLEAYDESVEESPIVNIFRNNPVSQGGVSHEALVKAVVEPVVAYETGCRAYPNIPVETMQGREIVLSAVASKGWKFDGWFVGDTQVATTTQAVIINTYEGEVFYKARFSPAV